MATSVESVPAKPDNCPVSAALGDVATHTRLLQHTRRMLGTSGSLPLSLKADAEELVAVACAIAWEKRREYDPTKGSVRSWIRGIIITLIRQRKPISVRRTINGDTASVEAALAKCLRPDENAASNENRAMVTAALQKLSKLKQQLIRGYFYDDLSDAQQAEHTGLSTGNVRLIRHRTIRELSVLLGPAKEGQP